MNDDIDLSRMTTEEMGQAVKDGKVTVNQVREHHGFSPVFDGDEKVMVFGRPPLEDSNDKPSATASVDGRTAHAENPKTDLKVVGIGNKDVLRASIEESRRNLPALMEHAKTLASLRRAYYLAYLEEGFTAAEALELCKS